VLFLVLRRHVKREDPALVWGPDRGGDQHEGGTVDPSAGTDGSDERTGGPEGQPTARTADEPADRGPSSP
jgi:hypothetical protein